METFDWKSCIRQWSRKQIELLTEREKAQLPLDILESYYLGCPGATEEQIYSAEERLDVTFPPSYRKFLKTSNGLRSTSGYDFLFYSTEEIDWYVLDNKEIIDNWSETWKEKKPVADEEYLIYGDEQSPYSFRLEYLQNALEISSEDLCGIYLLNPQIITSNGEWEAWYLTYMPLEVYRYRSFWEMMETLSKV
jgi:SMI1 / KNR4 family (SUKH-1)